MLNVSIVGYGCTPVGELWDRSVYDLGTEAIHAALDDSRHNCIDALVVGNMLSGVLSGQENLGAVLADRAGLAGVEAFKVEASCASGAAALRAGAMLVTSGCCRRVVVVAVEKMTDSPPATVSGAVSSAADFEGETLFGASFLALAALLTSLYAQATGTEEVALAEFPVNAHRHALDNPMAMFHRAVSIDDWFQSPVIASPLRVLDCAPVSDGAAAVILENRQAAENAKRPIVELLACEGATDAISVTHRQEPLRLRAVERSTSRALTTSGLTLDQLDLFEPHDAFPVTVALSLEAVGLMPRGEGWQYFLNSRTPPHGRIPLQTMGGLKARGHPVGATGLYQVVEACRQLRGEAGGCQIPHATAAMTSSLGGLASNAYATVLQRRPR